MSPEFKSMTVRQRQDALIAALRSGEHKQGRGRLRDSHGNECCLGVACGIAGLDMERDEIDEGGAFLFSFDGDSGTSYMPDGSWQLFGFYDGDGPGFDSPLSLAGMNDRGKTFAEIADLLEPMGSPYWKRADPDKQNDGDKRCRHFG